MSPSSQRRPGQIRLPAWLPTALVWCLLLLAAAGTLWLLARVLVALIVVTTAVVAATLLTALLEPLTSQLVRWRLPRWLAALSTMLLTLAALGGFGFFLVERVVQQSEDLSGALSESGERLRQLLLESSLPIDAEQLDQVPGRLLDALRAALPPPSTGAGIAVDIASALALTLFLWFFMLKDGRSFLPWLLSWSPRDRRAGLRRSGELAWEVITRYVLGTVVIASADAVGAGIVMAILGVPMTLSLALLIFLGAFVPIVGSTIAGVVAVAVTLVTVGPVQALILAGAVIAVQQLEGNVLQPLVMGRALHLHPAAIVLAVSIGALVAGVLGALVAVPVYAIALRLAQDRRPAQGADPEPAEETSRA